jgi:hypothetical protein
MRNHRTERVSLHTPLPAEDLKPYEGTASADEIKLYQRKVGSAQYATITRRYQNLLVPIRKLSLIWAPEDPHFDIKTRANP